MLSIGQPPPKLVSSIGESSIATQCHLKVIIVLRQGIISSYHPTGLLTGTCMTIEKVVMQGCVHHFTSEDEAPTIQ